MWVYLSLKWSDFTTRALCAESLLASATKSRTTVNSGTLPSHEWGPFCGQETVWGAGTVTFSLSHASLDGGWTAQGVAKRGSARRGKEGKGRAEGLQGLQSNTVTGNVPKMAVQKERWLARSQTNPSGLEFLNEVTICLQSFREAAGGILLEATHWLPSSITFEATEKNTSSERLGIWWVLSLYFIKAFIFPILHRMFISWDQGLLDFIGRKLCEEFLSPLFSDGLTDDGFHTTGLFNLHLQLPD